MRELSHSSMNEDFCKLFSKHYRGSYEKYTNMKNELHFVIEPRFIKKWIYEKGIPCTEKFDFINEVYLKDECNLY